MRGGGLNRKVKLERKAWATSRGNAIARKSRVRPRSDKNRSFDPWRGQEKAAVIERAHKRCEAPDCLEWGRDPHHNFGRTNEPYSSWRHLVSWLCRDHHDQVTGRVGTGVNLELRLYLRVSCVLRVAGAEGTLSEVTHLDDLDRVKWLVDLIERMRAHGVMPPEFTPPSAAEPR